LFFSLIYAGVTGAAESTSEAESTSPEAHANAIADVSGHTIQTGQFVQFGTYLGAPITWQVTDVDDEGNLLLFAADILTLKPFAAQEKTGNAFARTALNGSNLWSASQLRTWLNSADAK